MGKKVFDLKITDSWPILTIDANQPQFFMDSTGNLTNSKICYQHLSIPPDLALHLTAKNGRRFLRNALTKSDGSLSDNFLHLFSWLSQPIVNCPPPIGSWNGAVMITMPPDSKFTANTGIFVDFFAHRNKEETQIANYPYAEPSMRVVQDKTPNILTGRFVELIRKRGPQPSPDFYLSMRFGFWESLQNQWVIVFPNAKNK